MSIRIFLHGGNVSRISEGNDRFFKELLESTGGNTIKIVCVYFARPEHRWDDSYEEDQYTFRRISRDLDKEIETSLASYDTEDFLEKIRDSDIVFINGGMKGHLKDMLLALGLERLRQLLEGKHLSVLVQELIFCQSTTIRWPLKVSVKEPAF